MGEKQNWTNNIARDPLLIYVGRGGQICERIFIKQTEFLSFGIYCWILEECLFCWTMDCFLMNNTWFSWLYGLLVKDSFICFHCTSNTLIYILLPCVWIVAPIIALINCLHSAWWFIFMLCGKLSDSTPAGTPKTYRQSTTIQGPVVQHFATFLGRVFLFMHSGYCSRVQGNRFSLCEPHSSYFVVVITGLHTSRQKRLH